MPFIVATNIVASRTPKHRPTGTPIARANLRRDLTIVTHFRWGGGLHVKITNIREGGQRTMFRDSFPSVAKYLIGPPLLIFGPKSDHFFQQNQTKIGPKCGPNGKKSDFTRYCKKIHFV